MSEPGAPQLLSDDFGAVVLGWAAKNVFYMRFIGDISENVAHRSARRLRRLLGSSGATRCFVDAWSPETLAPAVKSLIVRAFLAHREKVSSAVLLVRSKDIVITAQVIAKTVEGPVTLTQDTEKFDRLLETAAPLAIANLRPDRWVEAELSRPPSRAPQGGRAYSVIPASGQAVRFSFKP